MGIFWEAAKLQRVWYSSCQLVDMPQACLESSVGMAGSSSVLAMTWQAWRDQNQRAGSEVPLLASRLQDVVETSFHPGSIAGGHLQDTAAQRPNLSQAPCRYATLTCWPLYSARSIRGSGQLAAPSEKFRRLGLGTIASMETEDAAHTVPSPRPSKR